MIEKKKRGRPKKQAQSTTPITKDTPQEETPPRLLGPVFRDGFMHMSLPDLHLFELVQHRVANALQGIGLKKYEGEKRLKELEHELESYRKSHQAELAYLVAHSADREKELKRLQEEMSELYKIDLSQVTYDDVSGKLMLLGEPVLASEKE